MNIIDIIQKKRDKLPLSSEEIRFFIEGVSNEAIPDYQISALLMAICINGMDDEETAVLTDYMARSGDTVDLSFLDGIKVDKHSSGGVGDKTTLAVVPMVAACGLPVAKMSGRGLGFSGGTIDKLESISGFCTTLSPERFAEYVLKDGLAVTGQTRNIAPADKKLYAMRDVTGTVGSVPLIAASIMSKKLASGADSIVLDVKYGSGAFMKTTEEAITLAEKMVSIGIHHGKDTIAAVTSMEQPLGNTAGNAMEVREAVETLKGNGPSDFLELCLTIGSMMLTAGKKAENMETARKMLMDTVENRTALDKLRKMVINQGGDVRQIDDTSLLPTAEIVIPVTAERSGAITGVFGEAVGKACVMSGAGRMKKDESIDYAAGILLKKKIGDRVEKGESIAEVHANDPQKGREAAKILASAYSIGEIAEIPKLIYAYIDKGGVHLV